jgi:DNA-nicking Smr family endonuclease
MAGRRLDPQERALWQRLAQSVKPLHPHPAAAAVSNPLPHGQRGPIASPALAVPRPSIARPGQPQPQPQPQPSKSLDKATLDRSWDRRLGRGNVQPERTIDLHGYGLDQAYAVLMRAIAQAKADGVRVILLITGRPAPGRTKGGHNPRLPPTSRGVIRASVLDWLAVSDLASAIAAVRPAHLLHGGAGALYVILKADRKIRA